MTCCYILLAIACALQGTTAEIREHAAPALRGGSHGRRAEDAGRNSTLSSESAVATTDDWWQLDDDAPSCEPGTASARNNPYDGWDPCCLDVNDGCDIREAVFQADGGSQGKGQWCSKTDWDTYGSCWNKDTEKWNFWTGGYVYDTCGCNDGDSYCQGGQKQECIQTMDDGTWWDWQDCPFWEGQTNPDWCWNDLMEAKCNTFQSRDVCSGYGGYIQFPVDVDGNYCDDCDCGEYYRPEWDDYSQLNMCIPNW